MKNLYYLGPKGSFSQIIAENINQEAGNQYNLVATDSFPKIARAVLADAEAKGLLVVENSITSDVHEAVDLLFSGKFWIQAEAQLKIRMNLIGLESSDLDKIKTVASKLPAIAQCSEFIDKHNFQTKLLESTSAALQEIVTQHDLETAAIGAEALVSEFPGTKVLSADIANQKKNLTRFVLVEKKSDTNTWAETAAKLTTLVELPHKAGSLADYLKVLASSAANLTRIESRPVPGTDFEYQFWIDLECLPTDIPLIIKIAQDNASNFKLLGVYQVAKVYNS